MIPEISDEQMKKAFHHFNRNHRSGFIYKGNHQYAVLWNERLYPTKDMIRLAAKGTTEIWYPDFSGSLAKTYFEERGYDLVRLPDKQTRKLLNLKYSQIFEDSYLINEIEKNGVTLLYSQKKTDQIENILRKANQAWIFQWDQTEYDLFEDYESGKKIEPWRVNAH